MSIDEPLTAWIATEDEKLRKRRRRRMRRRSRARQLKAAKRDYETRLDVGFSMLSDDFEPDDDYRDGDGENEIQVADD